MLSSRTARARLPKRSKPYFVEVVPGKVRLGWRATSSTWIASFYQGNGKYADEALGTKADDILDPDGDGILSFPQAQERLRVRYAKRQKPAVQTKPETPHTVNDALDAQIAFLKEKPQGAWRDAELRAAALIRPLLGGVRLAELTSKQLELWAKASVNTPPRLRTRAGSPQRYAEINADDPDARRRRQASTKRVWNLLKASLNRAWRAGWVSTDGAWRALKLFEDVDVARGRYLSIEECRRLINASPGAFRTLVQAALLTGARYGSLIRLTVGDISINREQQHAAVHTVVYKGRGRPKHVYISLTDEGAEFFAGLVAGRNDPRSVLLLRDDGAPWSKGHQDRLIEAACRQARIEPPASFNVLRHTWASHAVMNGVPLLVVAKNMGHSDTRMVERVYGHLAPSYVAAAIRAGAPQFSIEPPNVVPATR
jgi:integrase